MASQHVREDVSKAQPFSLFPRHGPAERVPHLDGIRAIALIGVLLFHFDVPHAGGGFAGVDVFLVLSGYLMTTIIRKNVDHGTFSLLHFCKRRFWRLYPAALAVTALTLVFAFLQSPPPEALSVAKSAISSIASSSNLYFLSETGYWDESASTKPLLHTWSLSLEEQFYLLWPLYILAFSRLPTLGREPKRVLFWSIATASISSFGVNLYLVRHFPNTAFYSLPPRIFEFGIGALCSFWAIPKAGRFSRLLREAAAIAGASGVLCTFFFLPGGASFPGFYVLPCVIGTAALILCNDTFLAYAFLSNPFLGAIGRLSYAAYLIHWPVWVFAVKLNSGLGISRRPSAISMLVCTFLLSLPLYHGVEDRIRRSNRKPVTLTLLILVATVSFAMTGIHSNGWQFRSPRLAGATCLNMDPRSVFGIQLTSRAIPRNCILGSSNRPGMHRAIVVGDSFASHLLVGLERISRKSNATIVVLHMGGCPLALPDKETSSTEYSMREVAKLKVIVGSSSFKRRCEIENDLRWQYLRGVKDSQMVILASTFRYKSENTPMLVALAGAIRTLKHKPIFLIPPPRITRSSATVPCAEGQRLPLFKLVRAVVPRPIECPTKDRADFLSRQSMIMAKEAAKLSSSPIIDLFYACCGDDGNRCKTVRDGIPIFRADGIHFSNEGAVAMSFYIEESLESLYRNGSMPTARKV